jgi:hypothetical protein
MSWGKGVDDGGPQAIKRVKIKNKRVKYPNMDYVFNTYTSRVWKG